MAEKVSPKILRDQWETPDDLFASLDSEFSFGTDLAANKSNHKCKHWFGPGSKLQEDALGISWVGRKWLWCNPPFSMLAEFAAKAHAEAELNGAKVVMLMPANRTEQQWFHDHVVGAVHEIRYILGRVKFVPPPGVKASSPSFGCMLAIYGGF